MAGVESLRGFVNTWACDENAHLNVQFYFGFFEDAAAHFLSAAGLRPERRPVAAARLVRFHSEMAAGQLVRVETTAAARDDGLWHLAHRLVEPATGRMMATALDAFEGSGFEEASARARGAVPEEAQPRSLSAEPEPLPLEPSAMPAGGMVTWRGRIAAGELDREGRARHLAVVARFSDANAHIWESVGAAQPWLAENDYGRVAVEMKVTTGHAIAPGLVHLESRPVALGGKTITFRHVLVETDTGRVAALGAVTALLLDRKARRSIPLPDDLRARAEARIAGG